MRSVSWYSFTVVLTNWSFTTCNAALCNYWTITMFTQYFPWEITPQSPVEAFYTVRLFIIILYIAMGLFVSVIGSPKSWLVSIKLVWALFAICLYMECYWGRLLDCLLLEWIGCYELLRSFLMTLLIDC